MLSFIHGNLDHYPCFLLYNSYGKGNEFPRLGNDILGGGNWEQSKLYEVLISRSMPLGLPADSPAKGPTVQAGKPE